MWSFILLIGAITILTIMALVGIIASCVYKDIPGISLSVLIFISSIILLISVCCAPIDYPDPQEKYNEYNNLIIAAESCRDNPNSAAGKVVQKQIDTWNEAYDKYTSKIGNAWDGIFYSEKTYENCDRINYWNIIYNKKEVMK